MKKFLMVLCAVMMVFGMVGSASATQYIDYNDTSVFFDENNTATTWCFDLDNDTLFMGDINPDYTINTATLFIRFEGDDTNGSWFNVLGEADLNLDNDNNVVENFEIYAGVCSLNVESWISDHILYVTIDDIEGEFWVTGMAIKGDYTPVPEPSTILLMGTGLLGLVGYSRKRFSKKS